jgi:hypothetical protein
MDPLQLPRFLVVEVHNFGGFFGGDTVTLSATPLPGGAPGEDLTTAAPDDEVEPVTLVIDEKALRNMRERHKLAPGMVFALALDGERVDEAWLLAAASHEELRAALGPLEVAGPLEGPLTVSRRCPRCGRWALVELFGPGCPACGS